MVSQGKPFVVNTHRVDPYKTFKFRVIDPKTNTIVMGVSKVSPLKKTTKVVEYRDGGDNTNVTKAPGLTTYDPITLHRGITQNTEFDQWARTVHQYGSDMKMDLVNYKKDLTLEVLNEKNQTVLRYSLYKCWVSEYIALPDLDASANTVAIEQIKIEIEGWTRDEKTTEIHEKG